jgi:hypothetical protein
VVDQSLLLFTCFDAIQGYLHVRNRLTPGVLLGRLVQLLGKQKVLEINAGELFTDLTSICVNLLISLLGLRFG